MTSFQPSQRSPFGQTNNTNNSNLTNKTNANDAKKAVAKGSVHSRIKALEKQENVNPNTGSISDKQLKNAEANRKVADPQILKHSKFTNETPLKPAATSPPVRIPARPSPNPSVKTGVSLAAKQPSTKKQASKASDEIKPEDITKDGVLVDPKKKYTGGFDTNGHLQSGPSDKYSDEKGNTVEIYGDFQIYTPPPSPTIKEKLAETSRKMGNVKDNVLKLLGFGRAPIAEAQTPQASKTEITRKNFSSPPQAPPRLERGPDGKLREIKKDDQVE